MLTFFRHVNQLFITEDGCHKFQKKKKNRDPDDVSLTSDTGYFPDNVEYNNYLDHAGETTEVRDLQMGLRFID